MVKVITIRDEVYAELYKLKKSKGMSFSEIIKYLLDEHKPDGASIISFAGSISDDDIDKRATIRIKGGIYGKDMP